MKATVVDLRYRMNEVIKALDRNENVTVLYHGKVKGIITPVTHKNLNKIKDHPFFGRAALERTRGALGGGGVFAVWTEEPDARFEKRLGKAGFEVQRLRPRKGPRHVVYLGLKVASRRRRRRPR